MRKSLFFAIIFLAVLGGCRKVEDGVHTLNIYVTTDVHGAYFSKFYLDDTQKPNSLSKVATILKQARSEDPDAILIDNGDNLQGDNSAFYFNFVDTVSQHVFARIANYLKYDATVVGNHDIEAGHEVYDRVRAQYAMPLLGGNAYYKDGPNAGKPYFDEYTIVEKNGLKVAIIGTTNPRVTNWVPENLYSGIQFKPNGEMLQALVDKVRKTEKPDFVIVATHCGSGEDDADSDENDAVYMARNLSGVDLVIGGHDHRSRAEMYMEKETPTGYLNPGPRSYFLGHAQFALTYKNGKRVADTLAVELLPLENVAPDADYDAVFDADYQAVKQFTLRKICSVSESFSLADALDGPSAYMNLLFDVQKEASGADIVFAAPLTSHGEIKAGDLIYNDLSKIYPFENKLYTIHLTGAQIKNYLEYSYDRWITREGPSYCYDSASGIKYKVYKRRPAGSRVEIESMVDGTPFELDKTYTVAMTSYRAMGGDGLLGEGAGLDISNPDAYIAERFADIRDLLFDKLSAEGTLVPKVNDNWNFVD